MFALLLLPLTAPAADLTQDPDVALFGASVPALAPTTPPDPTSAQTPHQVYLNFDGATLGSGSDDARSDVSQACPGTYPAYGSGPKRDATVQAVRASWKGLNMILTESRPQSGNFTMALVGPGACGGLVPNGTGIAPQDCDNANPNSVVTANVSEADPFPASAHAGLINQEIGHSYGLEHVDNPADNMNQAANTMDQRFTDGCSPIVGGAQCTAQHVATCGAGNQQNSWQELLAMVGAAPEDSEAPAVAITSPGDGDVFAPGSDFSITVDATDNVAVISVALEINGAEVSTRMAPPYEFPAAGISAGEYDFVAVALDDSGNEGRSATVHVSVTDDRDPTTSAGGSADSGGHGDGTAGTDGGGGDGGGCRAAHAPPHLGLTLFGGVALLAVARRRRI